MPLSVRLDDELDRVVQETAKALNRTRSEVVKLSLREFCRRALRARDANPYALAEDLLGRVGSGRGDLSIRGREYLRELLDAKAYAPFSPWTTATSAPTAFRTAKPSS